MSIDNYIALTERFRIKHGLIKATLSILSVIITIKFLFFLRISASEQLKCRLKVDALK